MSVKPDCHFSHYTAIRLHDLTEQDPKVIYINFEQQLAATGGDLAQDRVDAAFRHSPRASTNFIDIQGYRVFLLNGRRTEYLGIESRPLPSAANTFQIRLTDVERTLIDATVRPFYCGGVSEVLKAYRLASPRVSTNRIAALLKRLDYVYPYHQAVGFYLQRSGAYSEDAIRAFHGKFSYEFDFYLTYQMASTDYDPHWRLHFPKGL
jgi:predicted transcriptional regulator of viral defense system